ncbi:MAG: sensor domain-containing protein [Alphaproteobacteria bacterium]|nr:sensor domain-containing protein [Alphaproteobacteria bacterium]MBV9692469.1 sensor domain-containing protein [Alphaproteobacteria bacterium]
MSPSPRPETVRAYLDELRRALKGAPPGLIADALADTEDHLNNEIAHQPDIAESQILASVIDVYGTPQEIAEEYRDMEATIGGPFPKSDSAPERRYGFFNVISDPRTYGALLYMLLSLITGIFYFTWTVTGIALSLGLAILIIGIPFALLFIGSIRVLSHVEGRIVEGLLGVRMPRRLPPATAADETIWARIKDGLSDSRTWSSMFYFLLKLPLGIAYFVIAITGLSVSLGITAGSIYALITNDAGHIRVDDVPWLDHLLHTAPGLILFALFGVLLFFVVLHIARGIGWLHGRIAEVLLVRL